MPLYSHSRLSTFEQCRLKYKFAYIDKVETEVEESVEQFVGKRVHASLEKLYSDLKFQKLNSIKELLAFFRDEWKKNWNDGIIIVREGLTEDNYLNMAERFIIDYYNRYKPFNQAKVIGTEMHVKIALNGKGKEYFLQGYVDRLDDKGEGVYEVHDYKTNSNLPIQEYLDEDRQLALYSIAVKEMYPDAKDVKLVWHFLAFDKEMASERSDEELEALKKNTIELIEAVESEKDFKPKVSKLCDWCEFKPVCPMWKHLYGLEEKSANEYLKNDGVQLVNKFASLTEKKRRLVEELDGQLGELKASIIDFAERQGVNVIFGSGNKIRITVTDSVKLPYKNTEERQELNELLKKLGKWEAVAELDTFALAKVIKTKAWPEEFLGQLKKFAEVEKSYRLYLGSIRKEE